MVDGFCMSFFQCLFRKIIDDIPVFCMHHDKSPEVPCGNQRLEKRFIISLEDIFIGHEDFERSNSLRIYHFRQLRQYFIIDFPDHEVEAVIDGSLVFRFLVPFINAFLERPSFRCQAKVYDGRRAPKGCGNRA
ncbi:Uncharacterised protein [Mycobacteroides abscessus subsp. abscessus]|nr:Uncharacterised protein [Mycobacteroides abscessus subsp. abscessus]